MSTTEEKYQAIEHAVRVAKKEVDKLELIKSVSTLCKVDLYKLDMAKDCVARGEKLLREAGRLK